MQMSAASGTAAGMGSGALMVIVQGYCHRKGVDLAPEEMAAWGALLMPVVHFTGTFLSLCASIVLNAVAQLAGPASVAPSLTVSPKP